MTTGQSIVRMPRRRVPWCRRDGTRRVCIACGESARSRPEHCQSVQHRRCYAAAKQRQRAWFRANPAKRLEYLRRYRTANRAKVRRYMKSYHKVWYAKNRARKQTQNQRWERRNRSTRVPYLRAAALAWYYRNHEKALARIRRYYGANRRRKNTQRNRQLLEQRRRDPGFRLRCYFRSRLATLVRAKGPKRFSSSHDVLTYSATELRLHLEALFAAGMSWENYGRVWEVDHIVPVTQFDLARVDEARACFALKNLRPLRVAENRRRFHADRRSAIGAIDEMTRQRRRKHFEVGPEPHGELGSRKPDRTAGVRNQG